MVLAHQFFVWNGQNPETCDSETAVLTSGGLDAIDASVLEPFEYAALGHIHGGTKEMGERAVLLLMRRRPQIFRRQ